MSTPIIRQSRITFIWMETNFALLQSPVPDIPFAFLGRKEDYVSRFSSLQKGDADPDGLTLPWPKPFGQRFWTFYLNVTPGKVRGGKAWESLVPFRRKLDISLSAEWLPGRSLVEGFLYPHGYALAVTFFVGPTDLQLDGFVELARDIRRRRKLTVTWSPESVEDLVLDAFADGALERLRKLVLGTEAEPGSVASAPFSIVTFVQMDGADPAGAVADGGEVHRALEALTSWDPNLPAKLPPLNERILSASNPANLVYARARARAIWTPNSAGKPGVPTLACYSRNLFYASLQLESLGRLVSKSAQSTFLSDTHRDLARYAGGLLGRI